MEKAWGGRHRILPPGWRIASLVSAGILVFLSLIILERAGLATTLNHSGVVYYGTWITAGFFGSNTLTNLASKSRPEKIIMTPTALTLCILCFIIAAIAD
ncbi:MAG: hypothetical protein PVG61_07205 [Dehalococcoidia bacterium]